MSKKKKQNSRRHPTHSPTSSRVRSAVREGQRLCVQLLGELIEWLDCVPRDDDKPMALELREEVVNARDAVPTYPLPHRPGLIQFSETQLIMVNRDFARKLRGTVRLARELYERGTLPFDQFAGIVVGILD